MFGNNGINIEYLYAFAASKGAILVVQVSSEHVENASKVLKENNIKEFAPEEIYDM